MSVGANVRNLRDIARAIHGELDSQNESLKHMGDELDSTRAGIDSTEHSTQDVLKNSKRCCLQ